MDFYESYTYLENLDMVKYERMDYFQDCLDIHVTKVNPITMEQDSNSELNTKTQVWLEFGKTYYSKIYNCVLTTHDYDLDCGGDTFEEAIIKLAKLVKNKYGWEN